MPNDHGSLLSSLWSNIPTEGLIAKFSPFDLQSLHNTLRSTNKSKTLVQITVQWLRKIKENMLREPPGKLGKDFMLIATAALKNPTLQNQFQHLFLNRSRQFKNGSGITCALLEIRLKLSPFNQDIACTTNETKLWLSPSVKQCWNPCYGP